MNIADLKARLQNLNKRTSNGKDIWKPKDEHTIRLLDYPHDEENFIALYFHYEVGELGGVRCPKVNDGDDCVICDFAESLRAWKDENGNDKPESVRKSDFELFRKIQAKARVYIPMVERGKEADGPKFWSVTPNQADTILNEAVDADRLSECGISSDEKDAKKILQVLVNPTKAYDLTVSFAKPGEKGNNKSYAQITPKAKIKTSPLADKKTSKDIMTSVKNIVEVVPKVTSKEVEKIFNKFINSDRPEAKPDGGTEKYVGKNSNESVKNVGSKSIEEAFGELND